jgi:hydrogenase/urease accessory protein HupE
VGGGAAWAHRLDPGLLVLEVEGAEVRGSWTPPVSGPGVLPLLPEGCTPRSPPAGATELRATCPDPLVGDIGRTGPGAATAEVVVRLRRGHDVETVTLDADTPSLHVSADDPPPSRAAAVWQALRQGVPHVLGGADHVLFVVGMVLLVQGPARLLGAVTAFTAAHSLTLGLAALGALHLPSRPVEACIALSILLLAVELRLDRDTLSRRRPWLLAGLFGLVHGLGFAGALAEAGLPPGRALETLLGFNIGVEVGQLGIIALALPLAAWARRGPAWRRHLPTIALGAAGVAWTLDRVLVMLPW